ncbi:putative sodium-coupled neutral amino acid transporter 7 isoform X3 [Myotis lucifugus]|uniref:putative sodium-coupled neutral amino acid transporter 7 isoform X3 n=1 Tax=Myotis lucifugus TaxID=59463 RepID=UPI0006D714C5|nr:putative sodium-coupled neutral amino acid transporter 7 isoform X3 [Myotis lucifugus]
MAQVSINSDLGEWGFSTDAGERARLLQSPCVDSDPKSEGEASPESLSRGTTSSFGAIFIVVNACLGAGLLNFPAAFSTAGGVAAGVTLQMGMLVFIISGLVILAYCSQASNERTYQEVVWAVCGKLTGVLCEVSIAIYTFGTCIAFLIIIGDQQDKIIAVLAKEPEGAGGSPWYTDRKFTISLTAFLFILPLSIPREIGFQKYASFLSVVGTWYVTAIVIIKYIWPDKEMTPGDILTRPASWMAVFNAMPTICFGFQCHVSSVPIFNSMRQPEVKTWGGVVTAAMVIALAVYMGTAGGHWSVTESSWSPWEPSSSARPQPTPSSWICWHNHGLPCTQEPISVLRGHADSGITSLSWWDDSRDGSGLKSGPTVWSLQHGHVP